MIKNYIKIALRNIRKHKLYAVINIFGLSIGLASCLLIGIYIHNEWSYDKFHEKGERIVRTTMEFKMADVVNETATTGTKVGPEFARNFPEIENYVRIFRGSGFIEVDDIPYNEDRILYADPDFFKVFSFDMKEGNPSEAINEQNKIVLTTSTAKKYFGSESPVNKVIILKGKEMVVSGVCADPPQHSQLKFDFVTHFYNISPDVEKEIWWSANWYTYFLLQPHTDIAALENKINAYMSGARVKEETRVDGENYLRYHLEPLQEVHLTSELAGIEPNGSNSAVMILAVVTLLILLIACANYTNLATAQSTTRSGEIGMRKVMGASRQQIFFQFISESLIITMVSAVFAIGISIVAMPYFNDITGFDFERSAILQPWLLSLLLLVCIMVSLLAGSYPAILLSGTRIMGVLKKGFGSTGKSDQLMRKGLIVAQFSISVFLIIYTLIVFQQMDYINEKDLGYNREQVLVLPIAGDMSENLESVKAALEGVNGVTAVTAAYDTPEFIQWGDGIQVITDQGSKEISLNAIPVDLDFLKTLDIELLAGRDFIRSDLKPMDSLHMGESYKQPYIINETLAKKIGWTPQEAIGKTISKGVAGPVVGVVKDFHFSSLHEPVGPLLIFLGRDYSRVFMMRMTPNSLTQSLSSIETIWNARSNGRPFNYHFLDDNYDALYKTEQRSGLLFGIAAALAIILACLGLFGLAAFSTTQRVKEIGIRRTLGASMGNIVRLISKDFLLLVLIAIIIAAPVAWWAASIWLQGFAYRTEPQILLVVFAAVLTLFIAVLTVGYHSLKASWANPVKSLRTE